ncbi:MULTISPECIES: MHYT domain-containing protein [unclassified Streptomyces]|uniref:MHYT domain-containing protein n=1 Tax=unclassified Streptomyces TaxID=2593676 RepID=UPI0032500FE6
MQGTIDGFRYGAVTPVAAYLMACLGGALGLRCIVRSLLNEQSWKPGWLALGAASIGCGIWTMHFIAMLGFQIEQTGIRYDLGLTVLSLAVAVVVVGIGVFIVGYLGAGKGMLATAGVVTGVGVAAMHYLGMAAMQVNGNIQYDPLTVALSVAIAIVAATAALWAAVSIRGFLSSLGASLVMGVAVSGMHYTAMAAVSVHVHGSGSGTWAGDSPTSLLLPMLLGPAIFLLLAGVVVMFDPLLVLGDGDWSKSPASRGTSAAKEAEEPAPQHSGALFGEPVGPVRPGRDQYGAAAQPAPQWAPPRTHDW